MEHRTGASRLVRKTSAPPSPVGKRSNLPSASANRNCSVPRTISPQCLKQFALLSDEQFRIADDVDEQNMPDLEPDRWILFNSHAASLGACHKHSILR